MADNLETSQIVVQDGQGNKQLALKTAVIAGGVRKGIKRHKKEKHNGYSLPV